MDKGLVRFGYWNLAFLGNESKWAAEASECAADQDAFWEYHDLLFDQQSGENRGAFTKDNLKAFAVEMGLEPAAFNECLDSGKYTQLIESDVYGAQQLGATSTPAFIINGQPLLGAQPFEVFQQLFDSLLAEQN